eukprot:6492755-Amphidinium_carterae.3
MASPVIVDFWVQSAVSDPCWWAWIVIMDILMSTLRRAITWIEVCSCCSPDDERAKTCPMRSRRAPELAAGELHAVLAEMSRRTTAEVAIHLGPDLSDNMRHNMLHEFVVARAHLQYYIQTKLSFVVQFPFRAAALAHRDWHVVCETLRMCLDLPIDEGHGFLQDLLQPPLREMAQQWLSGVHEDICSEALEPLCAFVASLRFAPVNDRPVEGQHAKVSKMGRLKPAHSHQLQSYFLRRPEMERLLQQRPASVGELAFFVQLCRNHHVAMKHLGLSEHPILISKRAEERKRLDKDAELAHAIYRADARSLYGEVSILRMRRAGAAGSALEQEMDGSCHESCAEDENLEEGRAGPSVQEADTDD